MNYHNGLLLSNKHNELLMHTTWMNLTDMMGERSLIQQSTYSVTLFICEILEEAK